MANCAIVGINWGDEGKGRMVDLLTEDYDVVVRFQGGGNAGHTVINEKESSRFIFCLRVFLEAVSSTFWETALLSIPKISGRKCKM